MRFKLIVLASVFALCALAAVGASERAVDRTSLWENSGRNVLWGFDNMYQPCVIEEPGSEYPYKMWFFGWAAADCNPGYPGCDAIFHARSKDLDHWEVYAGDGRWDATMNPKLWAPVVTPDDKPYDQWHNGDPSVVRYRGRYYMAFTATGFDLDGKRGDDPADTDGWLSCVMGATSADGIHWTKTKAPLLIWPQDLGRKEGYAEDPAYYGDYARPCLRRDGGRWRLWFDYWCGRNGVSVGYAENLGRFADSKQWRILRADKNPVLASWPNPNVIKVGRRYYCYADPPDYPGPHADGWMARQIFEATSTDGVHWKVLGYVRPDSDTPACQVPEAVVPKRDGKRWVYVFYACQIGGSPYNWRYDRIRYMRRPAD